MSEPIEVSADDLYATSRQTASWHNAVQRAEQGETVAVIAHGKHVADVVPSGELDRLRETIHVLSDNDLIRALADAAPVVRGRDAIRGLIADRISREQP